LQAGPKMEKIHERITYAYKTSSMTPEMHKFGKTPPGTSFTCGPRRGDRFFLLVEMAYCLLPSHFMFLNRQSSIFAILAGCSFEVLLSVRGVFWIRHGGMSGAWGEVKF
jgi:hypothetical protein